MRCLLFCSFYRIRMGKLLLSPWILGGDFSFGLILCLQDESMHSGADVEAFQAALNRDIGGDTAASQASSSNKGVVGIKFFAF